MSTYFIKPVQPNGQLTTQLIQMFNYVRTKTTEAVQRLDKDQLDFHFDDTSNSIGTLLKHIAALEAYHQKIVFEKKFPSQAELDCWKGALPRQLSMRLISGNSIAHYLDILKAVRSKTLDMLAGRDDDWLFGNTILPLDPPVTNYFCLFHLVEEEIYHLGQINLIKVRCQKNTVL